MSSRFERISDGILQSLLPGFGHPEVLSKTFDILVLFLQLLAYPFDLQLRGHLLLLLLSHHRGCLSQSRRFLHLTDAKCLFLSAFSCNRLQLRRLVGREFATILVARWGEGLLIGYIGSIFLLRGELLSWLRLSLGSR